KVPETFFGQISAGVHDVAGTSLRRSPATRTVSLPRGGTPIATHLASSAGFRYTFPRFRSCLERTQRMILLRPLRYLAQALALETTPRQLAWGFALGMLIGLVPKGNLIAVALMTLFCALRINVASGAAAISLFTWCGMHLDPVSHRLGHWLLTNESLRPLWT